MDTTNSHPESTMNAEPRAEHRWLQQLVGEWTYEGEATEAPGQPSTKFSGTERVRSLGDLWTLAEAEGEVPGGDIDRSLMTLGYDPRTQRFVGTWLGSMMTHLWIYDGTLDADRRVLTLEAEGPSMAGDGTMALYRDVIEIKGDDEREMTAHVRDDDGTWRQFMTMNYRRQS
jgi:hypothetical protein